MKPEDLKTFDPQRIVVARFGKITDEDEDGNFSVEWGVDSWVQMRIIVSNGKDGNWYFSPMTPEGRPYGTSFSGHNRKADDLFWDGKKYVIQFREMIEGKILREAFEDDGSFVSYLENQGLFKKDLSPLGRLFYKVVTSYDPKEVPDKLFEDILEEMDNE